jgi:hypothetical protein
VQVAQDDAGSDPVDDNVGSKILVVTANVNDVSLVCRSMLDQAANSTNARESNAAISSALLDCQVRR